MSEFTVPLLLPKYSISVPGEIIGDAVNSEAEAFAGANPSDLYAYTFAATIEAMHQGIPHAFSVPATRLLFRAAHGVLAQEDVQLQLPTEVRERSRVAKCVVDHIGGLLGSAGVYRAAYQASGLLTLGDPEEKTTVGNGSDFQQKLAAAVYGDTARVAGGARVALEAHGITVGEAPSIVKGSTGLFAVAKIHSGWADMAVEKLGNPYVFTSNLVVKTDESGRRRVCFTPEIQHYLRRLAGDGCPAERMASSTHSDTIMGEEYKAAVDYLIPASATTNAYSNLYGDYL